MIFTFDKYGNLIESDTEDTLVQHSVNANILYASFKDIDLREYVPYISFERSDGQLSPYIAMSYVGNNICYYFSDAWITEKAGILKCVITLKQDNIVKKTANFNLNIVNSLSGRAITNVDETVISELEERLYQDEILINNKVNKDGDTLSGTLRTNAQIGMTGTNGILTFNAEQFNKNIGSIVIRMLDKPVIEMNIEDAGQIKTMRFATDGVYYYNGTKLERVLRESDLGYAFGNVISDKLKIVDSDNLYEFVYEAGDLVLTSNDRYFGVYLEDGYIELNLGSGTISISPDHIFVKNNNSYTNLNFPEENGTIATREHVESVRERLNDYIESVENNAKKYADTKIASLVNSAPETLDTLGEIAQALEENDSVVEALDNAISKKADKTYVDEKIGELAGSGGTNTSDATATSSDILLGKTAYSKDGKIEGTIETYDYSVSEGGSSSVSNIKMMEFKNMSFDEQGEMYLDLGTNEIDFNYPVSFDLTSEYGDHDIVTIKVVMNFAEYTNHIDIFKDDYYALRDGRTEGDYIGFASLYNNFFRKIPSSISLVSNQLNSSGLINVKVYYTPANETTCPVAYDY